MVAGLSPGQDAAEQRRSAQQARLDLGQYLAGLIEEHRHHPGDDILSAWITDEGPEGRMSLVELITTAVLLLIAGHETTVNLITNGMLTLLRRPEALDRLGDAPHTAPETVEELLRFEPPVHDRQVAGTAQDRARPVVAQSWSAPGCR
ncbi:cytochrome P450 [Saccharopolyspora phatthalungensis]|uniref:Cytochrome P450 n=1 Tax=Saccharopolyspora phatthalungensis TaxID=664693 RepID=A0A840QF06_9PSEU|nr:cytochrome P450 [Saccharopolyspora phatthalungensis]MBB5158627.1 cytochrome P450 [Saccharopolyspora phatthalungensis]